MEPFILVFLLQQDGDAIHDIPPFVSLCSVFPVIVKWCNPLLGMARHTQMACLFLIAFVMDNDVLAFLMLASLAILSDKSMLYILLRNHISVAILLYLTYRLIAQLHLHTPLPVLLILLMIGPEKLDGKCLFCKDFLHEGNLFAWLFGYFSP